MAQKWYEKPIYRSNFSIRIGKDGKIYIRHSEWDKNIYIGPYDTMIDANNVMDAYVKASKIGPLDRHCNEYAVSSVHVENDKLFFI